MELTNLGYLGMTAGEIKIYQVLLEHGPQSAAAIIKQTNLKKGDAYNKLYDLIQKGLIEEYEEKKKKHFRLVDPRRLDELTTTQYQTALQAKREIEALLPQVISTYTLTHHKPGIIMFEGEAAQQRVLEDSLSAAGDILQYVDLSSLLHHFPTDNTKNAKKREQLGKKKRILVKDDQIGRDYATKSRSALTEIKFIDYPLPKFQAAMLLYNSKVSYLTLRSDSMIGVIIEDPYISQMHQNLFEYNWSLAQD